MKKIITILIIVLSCFALSSCFFFKKDGDSSNMRLIVPKELNHSKEDIEIAKNCVTEEFKSLKNCKLESLKYLSEISENEIDFPDVGERENTIVFESSFMTGEDGPDLGLNSSIKYNDFWIIERKDKLQQWKLTKSGRGMRWKIVETLG